MTEKRFTRHKSLDGDCTIYDELNNFQFPSLPLGVSKIFCDKLNELAEENEQMKEENKELKENVGRFINDAILEILDGQRYEGERILNKALELLK